jgi:hypothetical protein
MADFLSRLAARTLGVARTVQPQIAPMYAPEQRMGGSPTQPDMPLLEVDAETSPARRGGQQRPLPLPPGEFGDPVERLPGPLSAAPEPVRLIAPLSQETDRFREGIGPVELRSPAIERDEGGFSAAWSAPESHPAGDVSLKGPLVEAVSRAEDAPPLPVEKPALRPAPADWQPLITPDERASGSGVVSSERQPLQAGIESDQAAREGMSEREAPYPATQSTSERRDGRSPMPVRPQVSEYRGRSEGLALVASEATAERAAPAPTIQVTIGRIEVRATPPPAAQRPQHTRSSPPVMGLDEYLKQRAKGGR